MIDQTYEFWELILIDDGSTDFSGEICDGFCYDTRIKVIHQNNAGALQSRIKGITVAKGVYALGLDADDYLDRKCLETIKKAIDASGSDLIFFGYRFVGSQRGHVKCTLAPEKVYLQKEILKEIIANTNHALWNKAIRTDKMREADYSGLRKKLSVNLDYAQIIPIMCNIKTGYVIHDILYNYRIYENSISHSCKAKHIFDTGWVSEYTVRKLKQYSLIDSDMYGMINLAYLKMIGPRLVTLFKNKGISKEDCQNIHKSKIYIRSKRAESLDKFGKFNFIVLKMFRYKQYWALRLMARLQP